MDGDKYVCVLLWKDLHWNRCGEEYVRSSLILYQTALVSSLAPIGQLTDRVDRNLAPTSKRRSVIDDSNECVLRTVSTAAIRLRCSGCSWTGQ